MMFECLSLAMNFCVRMCGSQGAYDLEGVQSLPRERHKNRTAEQYQELAE
jgi:hypothetical protein